MLFKKNYDGLHNQYLRFKLKNERCFSHDQMQRQYWNLRNAAMMFFDET